MEHCHYCERNQVWHQQIYRLNEFTAKVDFKSFENTVAKWYEENCEEGHENSSFGQYHVGF